MLNLENILPSPWGKYHLRKEEVERLTIGSLRLSLTCAAGDILVGHQYFGTSANTPYDLLNHTEESNTDETLQWRRWAVEQHSPVVRLSPCLPDRPVVAQPEKLLNLPGNHSTEVFVSVPIWIAVLMDTNPAAPLLELPSVLLSKTWFGGFTEGELCYWVTTRMRQEVDYKSSYPFLATCPVMIINRSADDLKIEKVCLQNQYLTLFWERDRLWTDEMELVYRGDAAASQIEASGAPPTAAPQALLVSPPREVLKKGLVGRSFAALTDLPGVGVLFS